MPTPASGGTAAVADSSIWGQNVNFSRFVPKDFIATVERWTSPLHSDHTAQDHFDSDFVDGVPLRNGNISHFHESATARHQRGIRGSRSKGICSPVYTPREAMRVTRRGLCRSIGACACRSSSQARAFAGPEMLVFKWTISPRQRAFAP